MNSTQMNHNRDPVMDVLQSIVALPADDQVRLRGALQAVGRDIWGQAEASDNRTAVASPGNADEESLEDVIAGVSRWMDSIAKGSPRQQIEMLEKALDEEDVEEVRRILQQRLSLLKNQNRKVAFELALFKYAYEHPIMSLIALFGIGAGVYKLGKGVLALIF